MNSLLFSETFLTKIMALSLAFPAQKQREKKRVQRLLTIKIPNTNKFNIQLLHAEPQRRCPSPGSPS